MNRSKIRKGGETLSSAKGLLYKANSLLNYRIENPGSSCQHASRMRNSVGSGTPLKSSRYFSEIPVITQSVLEAYF